MINKVVIAGSSSLKEEMRKWADYWNNKPDYSVIDWPKPIEKQKLKNLYPENFKKFFENITLADIVFVANEDKKGIEGYVGAETFAELTFAVSQNLLFNKNIDILLAKMPSNKIQSFDEINLWLEIGWIKLFDSKR